MERVAFSVRPFRPAWWLPGGHAQSIVGRFLRPAVHLELRRERVETPDGDFFDLDHVANGDAAADRSLPPGRVGVGVHPRRSTDDGAPVVLVLHGLEGSARSRYMLMTYRALGAHGLRAVGFNCRSCSGEMNRRPRSYHSGETSDLELALRHLAARFPRARRGAIGFSLGGNMLLRLLGEKGVAGAELVSAAAAVSVPFDLAAGAARIAYGPMGRLYSHYFLRKLRRKVRAKAALLDGGCAWRAGLRARTLAEFDEAVTAPLHGFADAEDYYRRASCGPLIESIRVPTLLLHSADDPFLPANAVPRAAAERNPNIVAGFTERGGHQGYVAGRWPWAPEFWVEAEAARFVAEMLQR